MPYSLGPFYQNARALLPALLLGGCSGGVDLLLPGDGEPASIEVQHGDGQSGRVGEPLADSLVFAVTDSRGRPVEGARIAFELTSAGPGADVVPDTAQTDANGMAHTRLVLGTTTGPQLGEARVLVNQGAREPKTTFTATALSETASGMVALSGDGQSGTAGSTLSQRLVVQVTDVFGNPISGVPITWTAEAGGSVSESSNLTDGQGLASVQRILGTASGQQSTLASSPGLAGSPVTFVHTALPGSVSGLSIVSGNDQTAEAGTELPGDLVIRLVDGAGNGVPGAAVTWVVGTGGGSVSPQNTITDEAGRTSARWTLGPTPGENRVDAVVSGVGVVNFRAVGTAAAPAALSIVTEPSPTARNGAPLERQPVVQIRDAQGNPVATAGIPVTAQLAGGGGELLGSRLRSTDGSGRAIFTDLAIAGAVGPRTLVFTAPGYAGATSAVIAVRAIGTTTTITSHSPDPSLVGTTVTIGFRVDAERVVPTGSVTVTDGAQSCSGTLSFGAGSCQLALTTPGKRTLRATYTGSPGLNGSTGTATHRVDQVPPPNRAPDAHFIWDCDGLTCRFSDTSHDSDGSVVAWNWNFGDGAVTGEREPAHTYGGPSTYTVTLTVIDDDGATDQFTAQVDVSVPPPQNQPPTGAFTSSCNELTCSFDGKASDDGDGQITDWSWDFGDGAGSRDRNPRHSYTSAGTYNVTLTVTDNDGATNSVTHPVTVMAPPPPPNQSPNADFAASCSDLACTFTDQSSDPDGNVVGWVWQFGDGASSNQQSPAHSYGLEGTYTVSLTVMDDDGATDSQTRQVTVSAPPPPNQAPTAAFNSDCIDLSCGFNSGSSSDPDGTIVSWAWTFGDGSGSNEASPSHTYTTAGTYDVTLTVADDDGAQDSEIHQVTVTEPPPPPNEAPTAAFNPPNCTAGEPCQFTDGSSDSDGTVVAWNWDFGDQGSTSNLKDPAYTYSSSGTYTVKLRVQDDDGAESVEVEHQVTVAPPPEGT